MGTAQKEILGELPTLESPMLALSKPYLYIPKKIFNFFSVLGRALLKLGHFYKYIRRNTAQKIKKKPDFNVNVFFTDIILLLFYRVDVKIPSVKIKMTLIVANPNTNKSVIID